jgi:hypothetical protein
VIGIRRSSAKTVMAPVFIIGAEGVMAREKAMKPKTTRYWRSTSFHLRVRNVLTLSSTLNDVFRRVMSFDVDDESFSWFWRVRVLRLGRYL